MKKILIIRLSSLGDVILTTPLIRKLRHHYPDSLIDFCTKEEYADIIRYNPAINKLIIAENDLDLLKTIRLRKILRDEHYDLIIDAHNKFITFLLRMLIKGKKLKLRKYSLRKFLLVNFKINLMKKLPPIVERYLDITHQLDKGYTPGDDERQPEIYTGKDAQSRAEQLFNEINHAGKKIICFIPSSKHYTKTYPPEMYAELINMLDSEKFSIITAGKGDDRIITEKIKSLSGDKIFDICDRVNLPELAEIIKRCSLVIGGDTGPMHIAEAFNTPLIMLAGSSVKEFGFYPQSVNSVVIENEALKCRPCSHIGRDFCPKGHFKCMTSIMPGRIKEVLNLQ